MYHPLDEDGTPGFGLAWKLCRMLNASWCGLHPSYRMRFIVESEKQGLIRDCCNEDSVLDLKRAKEMLIEGFGWNSRYIDSLR